MADTLSAKYGSTHATMAKIMLRLKHRRHGFKPVRVWQAPSGDPYVDAGSQDTYPVQIGDWAYRIDSDEVFICSVAPAANTDSTFIQCHA